MNGEAVGVVPELIGVLAVVVALVYLARQVSDTKKAIRRLSIAIGGTTFNQLHQTVAGCPELAEALGKLHEGEVLSRSEHAQVQSWAIAQVNAFDQMYVQSLAIDDSAAIEAIGEMVSTFFEYYCISEYWDELKVYSSARFRDFVHSRVGI